MSNQSDERAIHLEPEIATRLSAAFDWEDPPGTLAEFAAGTRSTFDTSLGAEDMCTTDESPHEARVGDDTYRYQCVLDAFVLGGILEAPVTVHTACPVSDEAMTAEFEDGELSDLSAPDEAVMSVGVKRTVSAPEGTITPEKLYGQLCGYSHAFASRDEYDEWAGATPEAVTQAVSLPEGLRGVRRMVAAGPFDPGGGSTNRTDCC